LHRGQNSAIITNEDNALGNWKPLLQMFGNFALSFVCGLLVYLFLGRHLPRFNSMWIPDIGLTASWLASWLVSTLIQKHHMKKNAHR
jgi:hypothetical protein